VGAELGLVLAGGEEDEPRRHLPGDRGQVARRHDGGQAVAEEVLDEEVPPRGDQDLGGLDACVAVDALVAEDRAAGTGQRGAQRSGFRTVSTPSFVRNEP
jgi:hypothetical protein